MNKKIKEQAYSVIAKIAEEHCHRTFAYLDKDDLYQEIWTICLDKLDTFKIDTCKNLLLDKQLEHYFRCIVSNRLVNKFKKVTKSVRNPCIKCPNYKPKSKNQCGADRGVESCIKKVRVYNLSVESRNSLLSCLDHMSSDNDYININTRNVLGDIITKETIDDLYVRLDPELHFYLDRLLA